MNKKSLKISIMACLFISTSLFATSQTLPKGIMSINLWHHDQEFDRVGAQLPNGDIKFVKARDYTAGRIPSLQPLISQGLMNENVQLAETFGVNNTVLNLAYGITDRLTMSLEFSYINASLVYHDDYISAMETITGILDGAGAARNGAYIPPKMAKADGLGDTLLAFKYRISENTAIAVGAIAGFLKTGQDARDKPADRDRFQSLETGERHDRYIITLFQSFPVNERYKVHLTGGYIMHMPGGWENILGNDFETDNGEEGFILLSNELKVNSQWDFYFNYLFQASEHDRQKVNGGPAYTITNSDTQFGLATFKMVYKPVIFLHLWADYSVIHFHEDALGIYEFPGRLDPSPMFRIGTQVFLKFL